MYYCLWSCILTYVRFFHSCFDLLSSQLGSSSILASTPRPSALDLSSFWPRSPLILASVFFHSGFVLPSFWPRSSFILVSISSHSGFDLPSFWLSHQLIQNKGSHPPIFYLTLDPELSKTIKNYQKLSKTLKIIKHYQNDLKFSIRRGPRKQTLSKITKQ